MAPSPTAPSPREVSFSELLSPIEDVIAAQAVGAFQMQGDGEGDDEQKDGGDADAKDKKKRA